MGSPLNAFFTRYFKLRRRALKALGHETVRITGTAVILTAVKRKTRTVTRTVRRGITSRDGKGPVTYSQ
jgi:hypothetical protein